MNNKFAVKCHNNSKWYISDGKEMYLHKDKSIHDKYCGKENMFNSEKLAKEFLNEYLKESNTKIIKRIPYLPTYHVPSFTISEDMLFYAFRYCLGRMTGAVSECVQNLIFNWDNLKASTQGQIHSEIREAVMKNQAGMECDTQEWNKILELKIKEY